MTTKFPIKIAVLGIFMLVNGISSKPLKAQVSERPLAIPQVIPRDIQPPSAAPLPTPQPQQPPSSPQLLTPSDPPPSEQFPSNIPETFIVKKFEVVGSTVFIQQELTQVLEEFINRSISLAELYLARSKITDLYLCWLYSCGKLQYKRIYFSVYSF